MMPLSPESGTNAIRRLPSQRNGRVEHVINDGSGHALRVDIGSDRLHHLSNAGRQRMLGCSVQF